VEQAPTRPYILSNIGILLAPYRVFTIGRLPFLVFEAFLFSFIYAYFRGVEFVADSILFDSQLSQRLGSITAIKGSLIGLSLLFTFPIIFLSVFTPLKVIWHAHRLETILLIKECRSSFMTLLYFGKTLVANFLRWCLFLIGASAAFWFIQYDNSIAAYKIILSILCLLAIALAIRQTVLSLFTLSTAINTQANSLETQIIAKGILSQKKFLLLLVIAKSFLIAFLLIMLSQISGFLRMQIIPISIGVSIWYVLSAFIVLTLESSEEYAWSKGLTFRRELSVDAA